MKPRGTRRGSVADVIALICLDTGMSPLDLSSPELPEEVLDAVVEIWMEKQRQLAKEARRRRRRSGGTFAADLEARLRRAL